MPRSACSRWQYVAVPYLASRGPGHPRRAPGRPRKAQTPETRERIFGAAREVFTEVGYDAATFQAIASRADLTGPAVNYYFSSKLELYREVIERIAAHVVTASIDRAAGEATLPGQLSAFITAAVQAYSADRSAALLLTSALESRRHPDLLDIDHRGIADTWAFLTGATNAAIKRGELPADADVTALLEMLAALLCGMGFYAVFIGSQRQLEDLTVQLRRLLVDDLWRFRA
jgi:AcrR family transcriptional regulator